MNNIPKIFFSYWDGSPLSYLQYLTVKSFQDLNPDWRIIIYMPEVKSDIITWHTFEQKARFTHKNYLNDLHNLDIEVIKINLEEIGFYNNVSEVHKSDYLRYHMLSKHGGMWSDMDILYIKPINTLNLRNIDTVISYFDNHYSIGILMSAPNNDFFKTLADNCKDYFDKTLYQCIGSRMIKNIYPEPEHIQDCKLILDNTYYLPFMWTQVSDIFINDKVEKIKHNTIGIHWFNGSPLAKQYQGLLENNKLPKDGSIYPYLKKYL